MENKIIFIIGPPRSGTTFLGEFLSNNINVTYFEEPHPVWHYGNEQILHDELDREHATPNAVKAIRHFFFKKNNGCIVLEKSPPNCLRLPFLDYVFPEAKFIFLRREANDCIQSIVNKWQGRFDNNYKNVLSQSKLFSSIMKLTKKVKIASFKFLLTRFILSIGDRVIAKKAWWGPRLADYKSMKNCSVNEIAKKQYEGCVNGIEKFKSKISDDKFIEVEFSQLINDPASIIEIIKKEWLSLN